MTDKEHEELATALLLVIGNRPVDEVAKAILTVMGDSKQWPFKYAINAAMGVRPVYNMSAADLREKLAEGYLNPTDDKPERFKDSVTDAMLFTELDNLEVPGSIYETMGYVIDDLIEDYRKRDLIEEIPTEVTQHVPH